MLVILTSCSIKWNEAIKKGDIAENSFEETINLTLQKGLIFTTVKINGNEYRFLFDSGTPLSISEEIQNQYSYKTISRGHIIDSDQNRQKVSWVRLDSIKLGHVSFLNQTAFVADFSANPVLKCLNIDGIIGSNRFL